MDVFPNLEHLTRIFSNATAPAFFLGAVAAFVSLMISRLSIVSGRIDELKDKLTDEANLDAHRDLVRRASFLSDGILLALGSGICSTLLLAVLFMSQLLRFNHALGAPLLFFFATVLLGAALFKFAQEAFCARRELLRRL